MPVKDREYIGVNPCLRCSRFFAVQDLRQSVCGACQHRGWHKPGWWADVACFACAVVFMTTDETQRLCADCSEQESRYMADVIDPSGTLSVEDALARFGGI